MTQPTIAAIQAAVCDHFNVSRRDMLSDWRAQSISQPRHLAMYLAREWGGRTYPQIARSFRRDHTSVIHGVSRAADKIADGTISGGTLQAIRMQLGAA